MKNFNYLFLTVLLSQSINAFAASAESKMEQEDQQKLNEMLARGINYDNENAIRIALAKGADPNARSYYKQPALYAYLNRWTEVNNRIVKLLLDAGANPNFQSFGCPTPLLNYMQLGQTPLMYAILKSCGDRAGTVRLLLNAHADPNIQTAGGTTALMLAAKIVDLGVIKLLLDAGANPNTVDNNDQTAADKAHEVANADGEEERQQETNERREYWKLQKEYDLAVEKVLRDAMETRRQVVQEKVKEHLYDVLADIVSEYAECPKPQHP